MTIPLDELSTDELRKGTRTSARISLAAAAVALVLVPLTPVGVPVLAAASVATVGLRRPS